MDGALQPQMHTSGPGMMHLFPGQAHPGRPQSCDPGADIENTLLGNASGDRFTKLLHSIAAAHQYEVSTLQSEVSALQLRLGDPAAAGAFGRANRFTRPVNLDPMASNRASPELRQNGLHSNRASPELRRRSKSSNRASPEPGQRGHASACASPELRIRSPTESEARKRQSQASATSPASPTSLTSKTTSDKPAASERASPELRAESPETLPSGALYAGKAWAEDAACALPNQAAEEDGNPGAADAEEDGDEQPGHSRGSTQSRPSRAHEARESRGKALRAATERSGQQEAGDDVTEVQAQATGDSSELDLPLTARPPPGSPPTVNGPPDGAESTEIQEAMKTADCVDAIGHKASESEGSEFEHSAHHFKPLPTWSECPSQGQVGGTQSCLQVSQRYLNSHRVTSQEWTNEGPALHLLSAMVMHPRSKVRLCWDILALMVMAHDFIMVPLQLFEPPSTRFLNVLGTVTQLYWNVDILANFFVGYWDKGLVILNVSSVFTHYLRTWFIIDVSLVSIDWIFMYLVTGLSDSSAAGVGRLGKSVRYFRFARSLRLVRALKMRGIMSNTNVLSEVSSVRLSISKLILAMLIINHLIACFWYGVGRLEVGGRSWIHDLADDAMLYRYTSAFHWSLVQFGVGDIDLDPKNTVERTFCILVLLFALIAASSLVSSITNSMSQLYQLNDRGRQFSLFQRYCGEHGISKDLKHRMQQYLDFALDQQRKSIAAGDVGLLPLLSRPLYDELQLEIYTPSLMLHPMLTKLVKLHVVTTISICTTALDSIFLAPGDVFFYGQQMATSMGLVVSGHLEYAQHRDIMEVLCEQWFSEAALWTYWGHLGTLEAATPSELVAVVASRFGEVVRSFPDTWAFVKGHALRYVKNLNDTPQEYLSDVPLTFVSRRGHSIAYEKDEEDARGVWKATRQTLTQTATTRRFFF